MTISNLFIRGGKDLGGVEIDAIISEGHSNNVDITTNPVEFGADVADHAIIQPRTLELVAVVSKNRISAAYLDMQELQRERQPISVQTGLELYQDMLITSLNVSQDKDTRNIIRMQISLNEVLITRAETVEYPRDELEESVQMQTTAPTDKGRIQPVEPEDATKEAAYKSFGATISDSFFGG